MTGMSSEKNVGNLFPSGLLLNVGTFKILKNPFIVETM